MTTTTVEGEFAAPVIVDRHPVTIVAPDGQAWTKVRVVVTPGESFIFQEAQDARRTVSAVRRIPHDAIRPDGGRLLLTTADGDWTLMPESGCRCGSRLSSLPSPIPADLKDW